MGVTPVTHENEWRSKTDGLPHWRGPQWPTLVIAPHPDDETLAAGGLISSLRAQQISVAVVAVTDGENAYSGRPDLGQLRECEQSDALDKLGVEPKQIHRLRFADSDVAAQESSLVDRIVSLVSHDTHLIAPWPLDFHPDHEACGRAAFAAAQALQIPITYYVFWTWHRGRPGLLDGQTCLLFPLKQAQIKAKQEALACHRSQLEHPSGSPILPDNLLWPARLPYEVFIAP